MDAEEFGTFLFGQATPDAVGLAGFQGVLAALGDDRAVGADRLGLLCFRHGAAALADREEELGINASAGRPSAPCGPDGSGRVRVRSMRPSISCSATWFSAFVPLAASVVPTTRCTSTTQSTGPVSAM